MSGLKYAVKQWIRSSPAVLALQSRLRGQDHLLASGRAIACLEGFPRSGNGFANTCVRQLQGVDNSNLAGHLHSIANVRRAVGLGLPTFVLVRDPLDCCLSMQAMGAVGRLDDALDAWAVFYGGDRRWLKHAILVPFERLTADPFAFTSAFAAAVGAPRPAWRPGFGDEMRELRQLSDAKHRFADFGRLSLPHPEKEARKRRLAADLTPALERKLGRRRDLYARILDDAASII
jgi:hypothetical protein